MPRNSTTRSWTLVPSIRATLPGLMEPRETTVGSRPRRVARLCRTLALIGAASYAGLVLADAISTYTPTPAISIKEAAILGLVEGITEYLPISSTGHLVLAGELMGLSDESRWSEAEIDAIQAYDIVIQAGAILAVIVIYWHRLQTMLLGLLGRSAEGKQLLRNVIIAFCPAAIVGLLLKKIIRRYLQFKGPVIAALAVGGLLMIGLVRSRFMARSLNAGKSLAELTPREALAIGCAQCLALWPGMSRSMVTILGGMAIGLAPTAATEFSFLVGLPTLLGATAFKSISEGRGLMQHVGTTAIATGLAVAALSAGVTVRWMIKHLNRLGFIWFGFYRIVLAAVMVIYFAAQGH